MECCLSRHRLAGTHGEAAQTSLPRRRRRRAARQDEQPGKPLSALKTTHFADSRAAILRPSEAGALPQRVRRFRAAKSASDFLSQDAAETSAVNTGQEGAPCAAAPFDTNCISPGTEFMDAFCRNLLFFCEAKLAQDASWRELKVLVSDSKVPGEITLLFCFKKALERQPSPSPAAAV